MDNQEWIRACREDKDDDSEGERKERREGEVSGRKGEGGWGRRSVTDW